MVLHIVSHITRLLLVSFRLRPFTSEFSQKFSSNIYNYIIVVVVCCGCGGGCVCGGGCICDGCGCGCVSSGSSNCNFNILRLIILI